MTRRFGAKDPVAIRIFYPYAYPADSAEATEYQRYIGRTNELSLIFHSETVVELRAHDEVKQGGYPISAAGVAGTDGVDGTNGLDGAPGMSAYQLAVSQGFVGTMTDWLLSLIGPQGPAGVDGTNGVDGADGEMPVPVWNGTELEWQDSAGTQLAAPADLVGPQGPIGPAGADGSQVNFATNADGTTTITVNGSSTTIGANEISDFEYNQVTGRLWITTRLGAEFEVTIAQPDLSGYLEKTAHNGNLSPVYANDGTTILFYAHNTATIA